MSPGKKEDQSSNRTETNIEKGLAAQTKSKEDDGKKQGKQPIDEDRAKGRKLSKMKKALAWLVEGMKKAIMIGRTGMYNRKRKLRLAVDYSSFREIDESNDLGSSPGEAGQTKNGIG